MNPSAPILIFGGSGQVGTELRRKNINIVAPLREDADLAQQETIRVLIEQLEPWAMINAAAWTAVDAAEDQEAAAYAANATGAGNLARAAAERGIPIVHISTDYVFDGSGSTAWGPEDEVSPLGAYGRTKAAGEVMVRDAGGSHGILRTSWVFSAHGENFVKTMLRLSESHQALRIVGDQIGGPTPAEAIADATIQMATQLAQDPGKTGTYHFSGAPNVSWAGFAQEVFVQSGRDIAITEIPTSDYPTPAQRPLNSRLNCEATETVFGIARPNWVEGLRSVLAELGAARTSEGTS